MNFSRQLKRYGFLILLFAIGLAVSGSGVMNWLKLTASERVATASEEQVVEYGASLSDWEAAVKPDAPDATSEEAAGEEAEVEASQVQEWPAVSSPATDAEGAAAIADSAAAAVASDEGAEAESADSSSLDTSFTFENVVYQEIQWEGLIPPEYSAEAIMSKYQDQLAEIEDGSPEAVELYEVMQAEFNDAPVNEALDETMVRIPGFIAPLEYTDMLITEFLLVPYFGACIHVPAPPANQTVLVRATDGQGIKTEDSFGPVWVMGKLTAEETTTELASAGYYIQEAVIEPYEVAQ